MLRNSLIALVGIGLGWAAIAADHFEAPRVRNDAPSDVADIYIFRNAEDTRIYMMITFGGGSSPNPAFNPTGVGKYDPDVLYTFNIDVNPDEDGDNILEDYAIYARFGVNANGDVALKVENLPGTTAPVVGPVETVVTSPEGFRIFAGLRDDPFFFDSMGFGATLATFGDDPNDGLGNFQFDNTRDSFGFRNITVIVIEMDAAIATQGSDRIRFWGATSRIVE